jgi:hypothetical protein
MLINCGLMILPLLLSLNIPHNNPRIDRDEPSTMEQGIRTLSARDV